MVDCFRAEPGITFHSAGNLNDACKILQHPVAEFDLMIFDCLMPDRGGLKKLRQVRTELRLAGIPIILAAVVSGAMAVAQHRRDA